MSLPYVDALKVADFFKPEFYGACLEGYCQIAGGLRRCKSAVHDIEYVLKPLDKKPPLKFGMKPKDVPQTMLDVVLMDLEKEDYLSFKQGDKKNKKYFVNLLKFNLVHVDGFLLDLWICTPPAQFGVQMVIRTGPQSVSNNFSQWTVTNRSAGGALPDGYRVKFGAVWLADQLDSKGKPHENEQPLPMSDEKHFLDFLGITAKPQDRRAEWGKYLKRA